MSHARARCWIHEDCISHPEIGSACGPNPPDMQVHDDLWVTDFGSGRGNGDGYGDGSVSGGDGSGGGVSGGGVSSAFGNGFGGGDLVEGRQP